MKRYRLVILFLLFPLYSYAQIYKWIDEKGNVNFTDNYLSIPKKYRDKVIPLDLPEKEESPNIEKEQAVPVERSNETTIKCGKINKELMEMSQEYIQIKSTLLKDIIRRKQLKNNIETLRSIYNSICYKNGLPPDYKYTECEKINKKLMDMLQEYTQIKSIKSTSLEDMRKYIIKRKYLKSNIETLRSIYESICR